MLNISIRTNIFHFQSDMQRTFLKSFGLPAAKTIVPISSTIALLISLQSTFVKIWNPFLSSSVSLSGEEDSTSPFTGRKLDEDGLSVTFSAKSMIRVRSRSTKRRIWLYNLARESSVSSNK